MAKGKPLRLGWVLRKWRIHEEMTVREAARLIGIHYTTYCRLECGHGKPDADTILKLFAWLFSERKRRTP